MSYISNRGYVVAKNDIDVETTRKFLTVKPFKQAMPGSGPVPEYQIYMESKTKFYVPKSYGIKTFGIPKEIKCNGESIDVTFVGELRNEQQEPVDAILTACYDSNKMGGILNVFCGGGKTTMALYVLSKLARKTVIIVHKDFLLEQWKERIQQFLPSARIGLVKGKILDVENKDIVIASLQSLSMKDYSPDVFKDFGTLIIDEVHHTSAEVFNKALFKTCMRFTIGLTATVSRKDGLSKVFMWHLGEIEYKSIKRQDTVDVKAVFIQFKDDEYCAEEYMGYSQKVNFSKMVNNVCDFGPRNYTILEIIKNIEPDRTTLVLSDRVRQLEFFKYHVEKSEKSCGIYVGGMKSNALKECEGKQVIFATYAIASEGYDQKGLDTLILASPRSDVTQSVGRILRDRECDRSKVPRIYDIVDHFSIFARQWKTRKTFYKKNDYSIKEIGNKEVVVLVAKFQECVL